MQVSPYLTAYHWGGLIFICKTNMLVFRIFLQNEHNSACWGLKNKNISSSKTSSWFLEELLDFKPGIYSNLAMVSWRTSCWRPWFQGYIDGFLNNKLLIFSFLFPQQTIHGMHSIRRRQESKPRGGAPINSFLFFTHSLSLPQFFDICLSRSHFVYIIYVM